MKLLNLPTDSTLFSSVTSGNNGYVVGYGLQGLSLQPYLLSAREVFALAARIARYKVSRVYRRAMMSDLEVDMRAG